MSSLVKIVIAAAMTIAAVASLPMSASANDTGAFLGGLAVGAISGAAIAGARPAPYYGPAGPGYYGAPVYYQRRCWYEAQPVFDAAGFQVGSQTVKRCG